ncbi:MAG: sensor histidine kinase [Rikenellaceae bacterium]
MLELIQKYRKVIFHTLSWVIILFITIFDIENVALRTNTISYQLPIWVTYIILFYLNYLVLIPYILLRSGLKFYVVAVILAVMVSFVAIRVPQQITRREKIEETMYKLENKLELNEFDRRILGPQVHMQNAKKRYDETFSHIQFNPFDNRNAVNIYGLLLVITISLITRFSQIWKDEEQKRIEQDKELVSSELEYLKQQINPHFLFNALNSIYSLSLVGSKNTSDCILKLSSILRYVLYNTNKYVSLADEMKVIDDYIGLQKLKLTSMTNLTTEIKGDFSKYKIEPLLLIPIIENAFKYGIDSTKESFIFISIEATDKKVILMTKNTFDSTLKPIKDSGIGLKNVQRRLDLIYPNKHKLETSSKSNIFEVKLEILL